MRWLLWRLLWGTVFAALATRFTVSGSVPEGAVIFAPNHSSHADTAALQLALARAGHRRVLAAGAEDYFFGSRLRSALSRAIGVFPFPRSGREGLARSSRILESGTSIILYPQGSRAGGPFRAGVGYLAEMGFTVVPVTIKGTARMLPKGAVVPRRGALSIEFADPTRLAPGESPTGFAARLQSLVLGEAGTSIESQGVGERLAS